MKALLAWVLMMALVCYAIGAVLGGKDPLNRRARRRDEIEEVLREATK